MNCPEFGIAVEKSEFQSIFKRLRKILEPYSITLAVTQDTPERYCLTGGVHPTHKMPMPVAWVQMDKNYVGFHHMGVYGFAKLRDGMSWELKARMQGKSCFNFKTADEKLFKELEQITARGFDAFKKAGFLSGSNPSDAALKPMSRCAKK
jgi:hypothetical protein